MKKSEVATLLKAIAMYYPNFKIDELDALTNAWHLILRKSEPNGIMKNLLQHVKNNKFPPTIADLVSHNTVPGVEDTKNMFLQMRNKLDKLESKDDSDIRETAIREGRLLLGLDKGDKSDD